MFFSVNLVRPCTQATIVIFGDKIFIKISFLNIALSILYFSQRF